MFSVSQVGDFIGKVYELGPDHLGWGRLAGEVARFFGAPIGSISLRRRDGSLAQRTTFGMDPALSESYERYYWSIDMIFRRLATRPPGIFNLPNIGDDAILRKSEFFNDYLRPMDCGHLLVGIAPPAGDHAVTIGLVRAATQPPFDQGDAEGLNLVADHLRRAIRLGTRKREAHQETTVKLLGDLGHSVVLIDAAGEVIFVNAAAALLLKGKELSLKSGRLWAAQDTDAVAIAAVLAAATRRGRRRSVQTVQVARDGRRPVNLLIVPVDESDPIAGSAGRPALAVLISESSRQAAPPEQARSLYGLTRQEARLAAVLIKGGGVAEAARALGIGRETVRFHLRNIFQKTNTHSQAELGHLLLTGGPSLPAPGAGRSGLL